MPSHIFTSIPILDLSLASSPDPTERANLLHQLHHALISIGFLYVSNHGVPEKVIADLVDALPTLFSLPSKAKEEIALSNSPHFLGYSSVGAEVTGGKTDCREQVEFATELEERCVSGGDGGLPVYERLKGPNQVSRLNLVIEG
jgi:isopenicillin N synthase-like dioxygenase